jgi:hypothetical protein
MNKMKDTDKKRLEQLRAARHTAVRHSRKYGVPTYRMLQVRLYFVCHVHTTGCVCT